MSDEPHERARDVHVPEDDSVYAQRRVRVPSEHRGPSDRESPEAHECAERRGVRPDACTEGAPCTPIERREVEDDQDIHAGEDNRDRFRAAGEQDGPHREQLVPPCRPPDRRSDTQQPEREHWVQRHLSEERPAVEHRRDEDGEGRHCDRRSGLDELARQEVRRERRDARGAGN